MTGNPFDTGNSFDDRDRLRRFDNPDLTRRILDQTSGGACTRAEDLLGSRWDASPDPLDDELLAGHLERCAACRELALILDRLQPLMPGLAEREPGPAFTARVLARTIRQQPVPAIKRPALLHRLAGHIQDRLVEAWQRPRIALEAAWVAAALTALLVWSPLAPSAAPDQALETVRAGAGAPRGLIEKVEDLSQAAVMAGREILGPRAERLESEAGKLFADLRLRVQTLKQEGQGLWERLTDDDTQPTDQ